MKPVIFGLSGPVLTPDERAFFARCEPAGYILFKRNIVDRTRNRGMRRLVAAVDADNAAVAKATRGGVPVKPAGLVATTFKNKPELTQRRCVVLKRLRRMPHRLGQRNFGVRGLAYQK